jgi:predicted Zn-dependent protease
VAAAHDAGYDPWGAVRMMRKFAVLEAGQAEKPLDSFFRSHPYSTDRVKIMSKQIETHYGPEGYFKGDVGADAYQRATNPHYAAGLTAAGQRNVLVAAGVGALAVGAGVLAYSLAHG